MRQVTPKPFNVYNFNELSDKAKQVAFNGLKDMIVDDRFLYFRDDCYEVVKDVFNLLDVKKFSYSITSSQGDGLSFTCNDFNNATINEAIFNDKATPEAVKDNIKRLGDNLQVKTIINPGRYTYAHGDQVTVHLDGFNDDIVKDLLPEHIAEGLQQAYAKQYLKICKQLEDNGYRLYDVTLEDVQEVAEINGYEFMEDGSYYHG
jgi:hypothetical protein